MLIEITSDMILNSDDVIGIFDFDNCTTGKRTLPLLKKAQDGDEVEGDLLNLPRSFILTKDKLILSTTTTSTIKRKIKNIVNL